MEVKQNSFRESMAWKVGEIGRGIVTAVLQEQGWYIIPSDDYIGKEEKAPRLFGKLKEYVLPDLDTAKEGNRRWVEVKTKKGASWTRITQRNEHGFGKKLYEHYLQVQAITGSDVWVFIYEMDIGELLYARLNDLPKPRIFTGDRKKIKGVNKGGMVYFPRDAFQIWTGESIW